MLQGGSCYKDLIRQTLTSPLAAPTQTNGVRVGLLSLAGRMRVSEFIDTPHQWKDYLGQGVLEEFAGIVNGLLSSQREAAAARKASKKPRGKRPGAGQAKRVARKAPRALGRPSMS